MYGRSLFLALLACGSLGLTLGCSGGGGGSHPTEPPPSAVLSLTASPNPILGGPCTHCGSLAGQREVTTTVTVRDAGGVASTAIEIGMIFRLDGGEVLGQGSFDAAAITTLAGSTRIPGGGQLVIPIGVHYDAARAGLHGTLHLDFGARDDNGHTVVTTLDVPATS